MAVRKVDTGKDEAGNDTYDYEFGDKVDGVFIPIVRKTGSYVDSLVAAAKGANGKDDEEAAA
jgi:hypothetical protein